MVSHEAPRIGNLMGLISLQEYHHQMVIICEF